MAAPDSSRSFPGPTISRYKFGRQVKVSFPGSTLELDFKGLDIDQAESIERTIESVWAAALAKARQELVRLTEAVQSGGRPRFTRLQPVQQDLAEGARTPSRKIRATRRVTRSAVAGIGGL